MMEALKEKAKSDFSRLGFPTRQDEDWKYTPTDALFEHNFALNPKVSGLSIKHQPRDVLVVPIVEALTRHADLMTPHLGRIMPQAHGFHAQNLALFNAGFFIYVPEGIKILDEPLHIEHRADAEGKMQCVRHLVIAEAASELQIIESYTSDLNDAYFTNTMTEVMLHREARVSHLKIQQEGAAAFHVGEVAAYADEASHFESHSLSLGGQWVRSDTSVEFLAPHASSLMNGIYMPVDGQHMDHHTVVKHNVPHCVSEQDYKGILKGHARGVFNGKVIVAEGAAKTEAKQYNKNVLLSAHAEMNTKPELQIFTDDVVCAHGATVGQLDEDALFYLATRGIEADLAHRYLMRAFLADNLRNMSAAGLNQQLNEFVTEHME